MIGDLIITCGAKEGKMVFAVENTIDILLY
jgi:hypothetical protein